MSASNPENFTVNFSLYPLLWLSMCFASGLFIASIISLDLRIVVPLIIIAAIFAILFSEKDSATIFVFVAFIGAGGLYFSLDKKSEPKNSIKNFYDLKQIDSGDPVEIEGVVVGKPELSVGGFSILVAAEKLVYKGKEIGVSGKVKFFAGVRDETVKREYESLGLRSGVKIRVAADLNREERFLNPGGVSFTEILDQKGVHATASIKSPLLIERLGTSNSFSLFGWIYDYRQDLIKEIVSKFNVKTAGILIASLLGNKNFLTKETAEIFREGGTFHILVISGLHITLIGGVLLLIVRLFTRKRVLQFLITSIVLWIYSFAVGAEIPVVRAALMFMILLFSLVIYRRGSLLNALGVCAFLILLWRPQDLFNQSFHLTFVSLFGIIAVVFPLIEKLRAIGCWMPTAENPFPPSVYKKIRTFCEALYWSERKWQKTLGENIWNCRIFKSNYGTWLEENGLQRPLRWIFEGILVTAVVQIFLLPFLILYFHRLSFSSVLLNLWAGVFVVLQNLTAIAGLFLSQVSNWLGLPFIKLAEVFNWVLLSVPQLFIDNSLASIRVPIYSGELKAVYLLYFIPLAILTVLLNFWNPFAMKKNENHTMLKNWTLGFSFASFFVLFLLIASHPFSEPSPNGKLTVDFLDVGQGDSALITFPNGETMLVDGGGRFNFNELFIEREDGEKESFEPDSQGVGEMVVSEFLWEKGYSDIDYVLATHADADHIQGLTTIVKNFRVGTAIVGQIANEDREFVEFSKMIERRKVNIEILTRGDSFEIGGVSVVVLNPKDSDSKAGNSSNNSSLVLQLVYGSREFLFTGDIENETEVDLVKNSGQFLEADIVKIAHHGSRTSSSSDFIETTKAEYAIIPVGRNSRFGHPHEEVVNRWKNAGAKVLTTGKRGTITVSTDGKNLEVQTFLK